MLGADLSLLRIRDKLPCTCEAQILGFEKGGVFSWGKDEPEMGEEEFYILSPDAEKKNFIFYLQLERKLEVGSPPPESGRMKLRVGSPLRES